MDDFNFLDALTLIFDSFSVVIDSLKVELFHSGTIDVNFWELLLGIFTVSIIFGFFLAPRAGSVLGAAGNISRQGRSSAPSSKKGSGS